MVDWIWPAPFDTEINIFRIIISLKHLLCWLSKGLFWWKISFETFEFIQNCQTFLSNVFDAQKFQFCTIVWCQNLVWSKSDIIWKGFLDLGHIEIGNFAMIWNLVQLKMAQILELISRHQCLFQLPGWHRCLSMHNVKMCSSRHQHDAFDLKLCDQERITNSATIHQPNRQPASLQPWQRSVKQPRDPQCEIQEYFWH